MKSYIKIFAPALIACLIFFAPIICDAQTISNSNTVFGFYSTPTYTVLGTFENDGQIYVVLRNPWGNIEVVEEETYLQSIIQSENRKFQAVSNVMKTKQDTANSTINNLR
jgi:hypothetical protein